MIEKTSYSLDYDFPNRKISQDKFEKIIAVLLLVYFSGALDGLGLLEKIFVAFSYLLVPFLIIRQWKRFIFVATRDIPLLLLVVMAVVSMLWSSAPSATIVTSRALIRTTLLAIYFATRFKPKEQLRLLAWALGIAGLIALLVGIAIPSTGIAASEWRGAFPHKNTMASIMVIGAAVFLTLALNSEIYNRFNKIKWAGFVLCFGLILLSRGKTALLILLLLPLFWAIRKIFKQYYKLKIILGIPLLFILCSVSGLILINLETLIVDILGKDMSFSGRTYLWTELFKMIAEKPWLGYGYYGFWNDKNIDYLQGEVQYGWVPSHAHSGFIDLVLMLGFLGLILFSINFFVSFKKALALAAMARTPEASWSLVFLIIMFLFNFNITITILSPFDITWLIYVSTCVSLSVPSNKSYV